MVVPYLPDFSAAFRPGDRAALQPGEPSFHPLENGWAVRDGFSTIHLLGADAAAFANLILFSGPLVRPSTMFWLGRDGE